MHKLVIFLGGMACGYGLFRLLVKPDHSSLSSEEGVNSPDLSSIEQKETARKMESNISQITALKEMSSLLVGESDLNYILCELLRLLDEILEYDSASVFLKDEHQQAYLAASRGIEKEEKVKQEIVEQADEVIPPEWIEQRTVYLPDVRKDEIWVSVPETNYIRSFIGALLFDNDRCIGVFNIDHREVDAYTQEDIQTVRAFADQAAVAIENFRLLEKIRVSNRRLQVLYELNNELALTLDQDEIIKRTLRLVNSALGGEKADYYQYLIAEGSTTLLLCEGRKQGEIAKINKYLREGQNTSDVGWVLDNQKSIRINNVLENDLWIEFEEMDREIRSLITVPVFIDGHLSGALSVLHSQADAFSQEHQDLLRAIAQQVGLALNNVDRFQEVKHLLNMLETHQLLQDHLFEHLPVGVLLLDEQHRILSANTQGLAIIDYLQPDFDRKTIHQLGTRSLQDLLPYADLERPQEIKKNPDDRKTYQVKIRQVESTAAPYWVLMITDVTSELETKRMLQMQQRLATLGQFAAGITHDFNNIISAILVYADILERDKEMKPENLQRVNVIREQSRRAAELIGQILDFSRRSVVNQEAIRLRPFLNRTKSLLGRILSDTYSIMLSVSSDPQPLVIMGDQTGLQQMLMNLVLNARDAMPQGGEITIAASQYPLGEYVDPPVPGMSSGEWVLLEVIDQGVGIPDSELERIFEPFYSTKGSSRGTGLGLSQVYGIVKQHDGFIEIDNTRERGTKVLIYFPLDFSADLHLEGDAGKTTLSGEEKLVLIVEDDRNLLDALSYYLEESNYQVIATQDGLKGLDIIHQVGDKLSLIITDVIMPRMGGLEMVRKAREIYAEIPVLFITGQQDQLQDQEILQSRRIAVLAKPFTLEEIIKMIKTLESSR